MTIDPDDPDFDSRPTLPYDDRTNEGPKEKPAPPEPPPEPPWTPQSS